MNLICPVCTKLLTKTERVYVCPDGHSFDVARQGYVHLLPVQQKHSLNPGDTRQQVLSRRAFLEDASVGVLTSLFALTVPEEFRRVLRRDGVFIQALAAEDHLLGLKNIIYPQLHYKEKIITPEVPGFTLETSVPVRFSFTVEGEQVQNLLSMTPHVYRIGKAGADALRNTPQLTDTASCVLNLYRPI